MPTRDPSPVAVLAARLQRAYPALSPYSAASLAEDLARIERAQRRHAERCCSGEDGGYVRLRNRTPERDGPLALKGSHGGRTVEHDPAAEDRAECHIFRRVENWRGTLCDRITRQSPNDGAKIELLDDPRGPVLKIRLPGETEATSV